MTGPLSVSYSNQGGYSPEQLGAHICGVISKFTRNQQEHSFAFKCDTLERKILKDFSATDCDFC